MPRTVVCSDCNEPLTDEKAPCPKCGSTRKTVNLFVSDEGAMHDTTRLKAKVPGRSKPVREQVAGDDLSRGTGQWNHLERVIDRENDRYFERVIDSKTGKVLHECSDPLSRHQGHGSDKRPKK